MFAATGKDLTSFLTSPAQVRRYRTDLLEDMLDTRTGKFFVIVRCPDGALRQEAIRTWNGLLPVGLPSWMCSWLDRKELPFLGDEVDTWLRGNEIVARGHYHAFGGSPSTGDILAQYVFELPEIVVANGVVPMVYLDGDIVPYGDNVVVSEEVFRSLRTLELSLTMAGTQNFTFTPEPSPVLRSFLGYLRDYRNVDIGRRDRVAKGIYELCVAFRKDYRNVFASGYIMVYYDDDPDKFQFVERLSSLQAWAHIYKCSPLDAVEGGAIVAGRNDSLTLRRSNRLPVADAGQDQSVRPGALTTLDGSESRDPDGNYPLMYSWEMVSMPEGSLAELVDADTVNPSFLPDLLGDYTIRLTAIDSLGTTSLPDDPRAMVTVSAFNTAPVAGAGEEQPAILPNTLVQFGTEPGRQSHHLDGDPLKYLWTLVGKPPINAAARDDATSSTPTFVTDDCWRLNAASVPTKKGR
jgi:hypothetical protein